MTWIDARAWLSSHPRLVDGALALFLTVFGALSLYVNLSLEVVGPVDAPLPVVIAAGLAVVAPIAWLRTYPLTVAVVVGAAFMAFRVLEIPEGTMSSVALFLALYGAGAYGRRRARDVVRLGVIVVMLVGLAWSLEFDSTILGANLFVARAFVLAFNVFFFVSAWVLGELARGRREREAELAARTRELEVERERNAERAVIEERLRIARELHDVLAHHVSVMGVQAGAARRVLSRQPEQARAALAGIEQSSRQAVVELQRMLGFLRSDDLETEPAVDRSPQPGLLHLEQLVADVRAAGLPVDLQVEGHVTDLPTALDLSAYRIIQEALTNTLKHGGEAATAQVTVRRSPAALEIQVEDDGLGPGFAEQRADGKGLVGMRERVGLAGGELETGPRAGGGFRVQARLPLLEVAR